MADRGEGGVGGGKGRETGCYGVGGAGRGGMEEGH